MIRFERQSLEAMKYHDVVKLAKELEVYRRYAPKAELIGKLLELKEKPQETLEDVSMPSFMDSDAVDLNKCDETQPVSNAALSTDQMSSGAHVSRPQTFSTGRNGCNSKSSPPPITRLTRQRTFDIDTSSNKAGTGGKTNAHILGKKHGSRTGGIHIENETEQALNNHVIHFKREGTFDVDKSPVKQTSFPSPGGLGKTSEKEDLAVSKSVITSNDLRSSLQSARAARSAPRKSVTSRIRPNTRGSTGSPAPKMYSKTAIPSVVDKIQYKKAMVTSTKRAEGSGKKFGPTKIPDFGVIHSRLFNKMESLVDSRKKVIARANSTQKSVPKCAEKTHLGTSSARVPVVRKLISPKVVSKVISPKAVVKQTSTLISKIPAPIPSKKKLSIDMNESGISRLPSPKVPLALMNSRSPFTTKSINLFGFTALEPNRRAILKVMANKNPVKRISPKQKAKQMLQTVRLNKRFELQMKFRLSKQNG